MKQRITKIAVIVCAAITLGLTACKKDAEKIIIGSWEYVSKTVTKTIDNEEISSNVCIPGDGTSITYTFKDNNTLTITETRIDTTVTTSYQYKLSDSSGYYFLNIYWDAYGISDPNADWGGASSYSVPKIDNKELVLSNERIDYDTLINNQINFKKK